MPFWLKVNENECPKLGQAIQRCGITLYVSEIKQMIPISVLIHNFNASQWNDDPVNKNYKMGSLAEIPKIFVRLVEPQLSLNFNK